MLEFELFGLVKIGREKETQSITAVLLKEDGQWQKENEPRFTSNKTTWERNNLL